MEKSKEKVFILILIFFLTLFCSISKANENKIFLSLKNQEVNLRQGPSFEYPIKLVYKKKYLPLIIIDKSEEWRKVKDIEKLYTPASVFESVKTEFEAIAGIVENSGTWEEV